MFIKTCSIKFESTTTSEATGVLFLRVIRKIVADAPQFQGLIKLVYFRGFFCMGVSRAKSRIPERCAYRVVLHYGFEVFSSFLVILELSQ
jgi:hypothetical protein